MAMRVSSEVPWAFLLRLNIACLRRDGSADVGLSCWCAPYGRSLFSGGEMGDILIYHGGC